MACLEMSAVKFVNFLCFVLLSSGVVLSDPQSGSYLRIFGEINGLGRVKSSKVYTESLKAFNILLSGQQLVGPMGHIGSWFLVRADQTRPTTSNDTEISKFHRVADDEISAKYRAVRDVSGNIKFDISTSNTVINTSSSQVDVTSTPNTVNTSSSQVDASSAIIITSTVFTNSATTRVTAKKTTCNGDVERLLNSLANMEDWALQLFDSWGKPGPSILEGRFNFVGNYRQCRSTRAPPLDGGNGFTGNYCVLTLTQVTNQSSAGGMMALLNAALKIQFGACMPDSCSEADISLLLSQGLVTVNLTSELTAGPTECRTNHREFTTATIFAIVLLSLIATLMVLGTSFDLVFIQLPMQNYKQILGSAERMEVKNSSQKISDEENSLISEMIHNDKTDVPNGNLAQNGVHQNGYYTATGAGEKAIKENGYHEVISTGENERKPLLGDKARSPMERNTCYGILTKFLLAFSVYTNGSKVLNTAQPPGSLSAINGIRFLSMSWVIFGHLYTFSMGQFLNTATELPNLLHRWTFDAISNSFVSVDTFFTLSGLLVAYITSKEIMKKGWRINWALFYFHRYWRLTPPYMLVLLITLGLQRFMGSGALWASTQPADKTNCEDNWWTNLLYVNNLVNTKYQCLGHAWYLANDMQFYLVTPLMLIPFYFHVYAGVASCSVFLLAQWITTGILSADNEWSDAALALNMHVKEGSLDWMIHYYVKPYCRIGPYVIGVLGGYLLAINSGRVRIPKYIVLIGWAVATATALAVLYGLRGDISGDDPNSVGAAALYNAVARSAWGACVVWVIITCASGYGGPVNVLLSWSPFVPLGRLTYMSYLIHPCLIYAYAGNFDSLYHLNDTNIVISYLGMLAFTYMAAFVLMLGLESPMIGLEKIFLGNKKH